MKRKKRKNDTVSLPMIEDLVREIRSLVRHLIEDIIQPRKFASEEIHLLVSRLKEVSNILVSHFYQDEYELKTLQKEIILYNEMFKEQKVELEKISTQMFPNSETIKRAYELLSARFDQLFSEKFENRSGTSFQSPSFDSRKKSLTPSKKRKRRSSSMMVSPEKNRRIRSSDNNVYVETFRLKEENLALREKVNFQAKRISKLEMESTKSEIDGLISLSREDAQDELIRKFRTLQTKIRDLEKENWDKTTLIEDLRRKTGKHESRIRWLHRVVEKHTLRKKVLERISDFESVRADLIKRQQSTIMSDSLIASVIDEQLSKVFETEENLIEEQRKRKKMERKIMTLEVELERERENRKRTDLELEEIKSHPPNVSYHHREDVEIDNGKRTDEVVKETEKLDRLYQDSYSNTGISATTPINTNSYPNRRNRMNASNGECFSRGTNTQKIRWCESYVVYLYHLMNEIYFINMNQKPDDKFLLTFLKLFKAIRLIYRQMRMENSIEMNTQEIRDLLPKPQEIFYEKHQQPMPQIEMMTSSSSSTTSYGGGMGNVGREKRRNLKTSSGRRRRRGGEGSNFSATNKIVKKIHKTRPHTSSSSSRKNYRSQSSGARWNSRSEFQTIPTRRPFQYYRVAKKVNLKPLGRRKKRF